MIPLLGTEDEQIGERDDTAFVYRGRTNGGN